MNDLDPHDDTPLDAALHAHWHAGAAPDDAGFSLRVMAALPPQVTPAQRRWARWLRRAQWLAISLAGCGAASLLAVEPGLQDEPRLLAGLALVGLLIFWTVPSRWNRR